jgi:hypothetical protein
MPIQFLVFGRCSISIFEAKTVGPTRTGKSGNATADRFLDNTMKQATNSSPVIHKHKYRLSVSFFITHTMQLMPLR